MPQQIQNTAVTPPIPPVPTQHPNPLNYNTGGANKISPHNQAGEWEYYSVNKSTGKTVRINMEKMIRKLEQITGESFIENE